jgi:hypothetical protein
MFVVVVVIIIINIRGSQCGPSPGQGAKLAEISVTEYVTPSDPARFQLGVSLSWQVAQYSSSGND